MKIKDMIKLLETMDPEMTILGEYNMDDFMTKVMWDDFFEGDFDEDDDEQVRITGYGYIYLLSKKDK